MKFIKKILLCLLFVIVGFVLSYLNWLIEPTITAALEPILTTIDRFFAPVANTIETLLSFAFFGIFVYLFVPFFAMFR
ncbi:MAG TPA: hypothetical protein GX514_09180 [Thermoanaerobacterales bacterium]|nr:hypothetical protein [Thermoanaerobacterales bacterium]